MLLLLYFHCSGLNVSSVCLGLLFLNPKPFSPRFLTPCVILLAILLSWYQHSSSSPSLSLCVMEVMTERPDCLSPPPPLSPSPPPLQVHCMPTFFRLMLPDLFFQSEECMSLTVPDSCLWLHI